MLQNINEIKAFHRLGAYLRKLSFNHFMPVEWESEFGNSKIQFENSQDKLIDFIEFSHHYNPWFTNEFVVFALNEWAGLLEESKLKDWLRIYKKKVGFKSKTIGVVMAGNIPMVGFHDYLSVLLSGHRLLAKLSSDDLKLIPILHEFLSNIDSDLGSRVQFEHHQLKNFDAIIATGSNNTSRYFEYYFGKYPHIIRKNRNGVAILRGDETQDDLNKLTDDLFVYFGLGCRSVSKLFLPVGYDFQLLFGAFEKYSHFQHHSKYFNNYEYQKAIYLVNKTPHYDNGFAIIKKDENSYASAISVIHYEEYSDLKTLKNKLETESELIQCVVGVDYEPFGSAQHPPLNEYADGVDTLDFLMNL